MKLHPAREQKGKTEDRKEGDHKDGSPKRDTQQQTASLKTTGRHRKAELRIDQQCAT